MAKNNLSLKTFTTIIESSTPIQKLLHIEIPHSFSNLKKYTYEIYSKHKFYNNQINCETNQSKNKPIITIKLEDVQYFIKVTYDFEAIPFTNYLTNKTNITSSFIFYNQNETAPLRKLPPLPNVPTSPINIPTVKINNFTQTKEESVDNQEINNQDFNEEESIPEEIEEYDTYSFDTFDVLSEDSELNKELKPVESVESTNNNDIFGEPTNFNWG